MVMAGPITRINILSKQKHKNPNANKCKLTPLCNLRDVKRSEIIIL
ncbi:Uncharacterised protein [uncultured archaeon]|nr:Uncharacterised protein [uncultured archaeon]